MDSLVTPVFKLTVLVNLYHARLEQLETHTFGHIHSTKLKNRILSYFPDMDAHKQGRDVVLICNEDIGTALKKACEGDNAAYLAEAAKPVRRDTLKMKSELTGSFEAQCQENSVPVNPNQFCKYASSSSQPLTATPIQLFGKPEQGFYHNHAQPS